ncbi:MAG TPA: hypothetical protein VN759_10560 [Pseudolysinimonas sp.]|nr:hypothetical protein [Pseudolysinimonas sp.]
MTQPFPRILVLTGALLAGAATQAAAQDSGRYAPRTLVPPAFPRWDVGASLGLLAVTTKEADASWHGWEQKAEFRADVGRYWTTHLKTEVAVSASNAWHDFDAEPFPVAPGLPLPAYTYIDSERRLFTVAPGVTWQFFENSFTHPYVSGGVKVGLLQEHSVRETATYRTGNLGYTVPGRDERSTQVLARPFIGGGFKSYITRAVFVRTEARLAFLQDGVRQVSLLAGVGTDF